MAGSSWEGVWRIRRLDFTPTSMAGKSLQVKLCPEYVIRGPLRPPVAWGAPGPPWEAVSWPYLQPRPRPLMGTEPDPAVEHDLQRDAVDLDPSHAPQGRERLAGVLTMLTQTDRRGPQNAAEGQEWGEA